MKAGAKLGALFISAAVLAGAWLVAAYMSGGLGRAEAVSAAASAAQTPEPLAAGSAQTLTALSWSYGGQTVNLVRSETTGRWVNADDARCPIDEAAAQSLARAAAGVRASMEIMGVTELSQYGLEEPAVVVVAATEQRIVSYEIGNRSITGEYYLRLNGESTVYLTDSAMAEAFRVGLGDVLAFESIPGDIAEVTGISVETAAERYELRRTETETGYQWLRAEGGASLDGDGVRALYEPVISLALTRCVSWTAGTGTEYGLGAPQAAVTVRYDDASGREHAFALEFGDYAGGDVYVRFAGSDMVYLVPAETADALMYPAWSAMTHRRALAFEPEALASFTVELGGRAYEVLRLEETTEVPLGEGEQSVPVTDVIYSLNGWVLDTARVERWLDSLLALEADGGSPAGEGRQTLLTVRLVWKDEEREPLEAELKSYDSGHLLCTVGEERLLVSRTAAEELTAAAEELLTAE